MGGVSRITISYMDAGGGIPSLRVKDGNDTLFYVQLSHVTQTS